MEVCTNANLLAYSEVISGLDVETATDAHLSEEDFNHIVNILFDRLNNFSQWIRGKYSIHSFLTFWGPNELFS